MVGGNRGYHPRLPCECRGPHSRHPLSINSKPGSSTDGGIPKMVIIRDIVTDFSEDEDIELCNDDTEGTEPGCITFSNPSSFFVVTTFNHHQHTWPCNKDHKVNAGSHAH
ncbi:unnamed protein product [Lupinus luteus]|uniref:Uncharacterized protein n=1 Tax=Lupinus luteus TaxID=3873 RepID=A0AAV1XE66_LUPLU